MALTFTPNAIHPVDTWGAMPIRIVTATPGAADYPTGGYTLTPGNGISLGSILAVISLGNTGTITDVLPKWNPATQKLQMYWSGAAESTEFAEIDADTDLTGYVFTLLILGINP